LIKQRDGIMMLQNCDADQVAELWLCGGQTISLSITIRIVNPIAAWGFLIERLGCSH
jgi:hypothetical protein